MSTEARFEDGKLIVTRTYEAPRELVFEAWVETNKVQQWWGCEQCLSVRSEIEPKVGGAYNHHMMIQGVEDEVPGFATLIEYDPPARLAYESTLPTDPNVKMKVTVDFTEVEGGTHVRLEHSGIPDITVEGGFNLHDLVQGGWSAAFEKLSKFLVSEFPS